MAALAYTHGSQAHFCHHTGKKWSISHTHTYKDIHTQIQKKSKYKEVGENKIRGF